jgi:hypothetical protein
MGQHMPQRARVGLFGGVPLPQGFGDGAVEDRAGLDRGPAQQIGGVQPFTMRKKTRAPRGARGTG